MCDCDLDRPKVWMEKIRKSRKPHTCSECDRPIEPGTNYHWCKGLWDGKWKSFKTCQSCQELAKVLDLDRCYELGSLFSFVVELDDFWFDNDTEEWYTDHPQLEIIRQDPLLIVVKH